jgi:hypothetical protein
MEKLLETIRFLEAENAALKKLVSELLAELAMLRDENVELRAEVALLRQHSGNSSKPPSSDIVKPPKGNFGKRKKSRRKIDAQNGHPKHDRIHFTDDQIDTTIEHELTQCPHCNGKLTQTDKVTKTQQVELVDLLPQQSHIHRDESGWKENGKLQWVWAFRASDFSVFKIDSHRSYDVLHEMLGDAFSGIVSCDFYSAYKKLESQTAAKWGVNLLDAVQEMFHLIHRKDELLLQNWLRKMLKKNRLEILD